MKLLLDLQGAQTASRFRGIGRHTRSLAKAIALRNTGHDVAVLLNGMLHDNIDELRAEFTPLLPPDRILTFQAVGPVAEKDPENDWRMRASQLAREAFVARYAPDMLHVGSVFEGFLDDAVTSIGTLDAGHPTAATLFDLIPLLNPEKYLALPSYARHYMRRAQAMKRADLLLALSESSRREAIEALHIGAERIAVIRCGVDGRFRPMHMPPSQARVLHLRFAIPKAFVLYVGAVDPRKNIEVLVHAFARLPVVTRAGHCLVIAGALEAVERRRVRALCARHGLSGNEIVFCGHVSDDDLVSLYNMCALFVFPSRHEGFGLPVLEAMACGAPILAANTTSLPEIVGRPDLLFDPDDAEALAARMAGMLTADNDRRAGLRNWGIERAAEFSWDECARRTVAAFESLHDSRPGHRRTSVALARRPRLAFLSPLPGDRTGIADYSAELLPELARFYEVECIIQDTYVTDPWILANYPLRDVGWFERNAAEYDRVVYSFGNSHFHAWMFDLLRRFPGIVVLHDLYLGNLLEWMSTSGVFPADSLLRELYLTHGLSGLATYRDEGPARTVERHACNGAIFRHATGVIVHSQFAALNAESLFGHAIRNSVAVVPFIRAVPSRLNRSAARSRLGIGKDEFLVCSFGFMTGQKQGLAILDAWRSSVLSRKSDTSLVFVGAVGEDSDGEKLGQAIAVWREPSRVALTGYVSTDIYRDYLAAADVAVQLRRESRGETSAAILDCLAAGMPVIVNAHGSAAELPHNAVRMLPDVFDVGELSQALERLHDDQPAASALGNEGRAYVTGHHHPAHAGAAFHDAVEDLTRRSLQSQQQVLISALTQQHSNVPPSDADLFRLATCISRNSTRLGLRQILCDVTVLAEQDAKTGIQRVVRSVLTMLVQAPPPGFRVEAVRIEGDRYIHARRFTEHLFGMPAAVVPDSEVDYGAGDIFLGIDWVPDRLPNVVPWLNDFRGAGGKVAIAVYDLLPLLTPEYFPEFMGDVTQRWFEAGLAVADQFICISRTVADDVERFASSLGEARTSSLAVDFFHMGSDLAASQPSRGLPPSAKSILVALANRKSFVMVGTVEPRKGHRQVLDAFNSLWRDGADVGLVIVGKRGWMVEQIAASIERHAEYGKRLFWLQDISDEMLDKVYAASAALIAASAGEGFGLPLIEAAKHGVALIARDIPVFREVAGDHAFYFRGSDPTDISQAVREWLNLERTARTPGSNAMLHQSWRAAVDELTHVILVDEPYRRVTFQQESRRDDVEIDPRHLRPPSSDLLMESEPTLLGTALSWREDAPT